MTNDGEVILDRLEVVTAQIAAHFEPSTGRPPNLEETGPLLAQRSELIGELTRALEKNKSLSYVEFNRLVIVHVQGGQIASSLLALRTGMCNLTLQAQRRRAYAGCLQGMIDPTATQHSEKV